MPERLSEEYSGQKEFHGKSFGVSKYNNFKIFCLLGEFSFTVPWNQFYYAGQGRTIIIHDTLVQM